MIELLFMLFVVRGAVLLPILGGSSGARLCGVLGISHLKENGELGYIGFLILFPGHQLTLEQILGSLVDCMTSAGDVPPLDSALTS